MSREIRCELIALLYVGEWWNIFNIGPSLSPRKINHYQCPIIAAPVCSSDCDDLFKCHLHACIRSRRAAENLAHLSHGYKVKDSVCSDYDELIKGQVKLNIVEFGN